MNGEYSPAKVWWDDRLWSVPIDDADFRARVFAAVDRRYRVWIGDAQPKQLGPEEKTPGVSLTWADLTSETTTLRRGPPPPFFGDQWTMLLCTIGGASALADRWFYILYCDDVQSQDGDPDNQDVPNPLGAQPSAILVDWELQTIADWIREATHGVRLQDRLLTESNVTEYVKFALNHDLSLGEGELCRLVENADDLITGERFRWNKDARDSPGSESAVRLANIGPIKVVRDSQTHSNSTIDDAAVELGQGTKTYRIIGHFAVGNALYRRTLEATNRGELRFINARYEEFVAYIPVTPVSGESLADAGYSSFERFDEEWRFAPPRHINELLEAMANDDRLEKFRRDAEQALNVKRRDARADPVLARANDPCTQGETRPTPIVCEAPSTNIAKTFVSQITHLRILFKNRVEFRACTFEGPVDFSNCRFMKGLAVTGCTLKSKLYLRDCEMSYTGIQTHEEADKFIDSEYPPALDLSFSTIQQEVDLQGAVLKTVYGRRSFNAQHLRLEGSLNLRGLHSNGELNLAHALIGGTIHCGQGESRLRRPRIARIDGDIVLNGAHIRGYVYAYGLIAYCLEARRTHFDGTVCFRHFGFGNVVRTRFSNGLVLRGAHIRGQLQLMAVVCGSPESDTEVEAIEACDVEIEEAVFVEPIFTSEDMRQALMHGWFDSIGGAINLSSVIFGDFNFSGAKLRGGISITSAKITGELNLSHAIIRGDVYLRSVVPFNPCGALLSGPFVSSCQFGADAWPTFDLVEVGGLVNCRHVEIGGSVYVQGIRSGFRQEQQRDSAARYYPSDATGLDFEHAHIGGSYISLDEDWISSRQHDLRAILTFCKKKLAQSETKTPSTSERMSNGRLLSFGLQLFGSASHDYEKQQSVFAIPSDDVLKTAVAVKSGNKILGDVNFAYAKIDGTTQLDNSNICGQIIMSDAVVRGDVTCSWPSWVSTPSGYDISPSWCPTRSKNELRDGCSGQPRLGDGRTTCTSLKMVGLSCLADVDISGLVVDVRKEGYGPIGAGSASISEGEQVWPSLDGRRVQISGSLQLARRYPKVIGSGEEIKAFAAIRGQLNLSYARAGQLILDGTSFQNGVGSEWFRDTLNRLLGWPKSVYRNDIGRARWLSRKDVFEKYGVALDRGEFGRLTLEGNPRIPRLVDMAGVRVTRWDLEVRDFIELLESAFAFRFDRENYLLVQKELRNEGKDTDAARVFDMLRSRETAIIRQWGQSRADFIDRTRQVFRSSLWPFTALVVTPYLAFNFMLRTLLLIPLARLWTTFGERALFGNFLHAGRPLLWALMAIWFAFSISIFVDPQNTELQASPRSQHEERSWSVSDAIWVSARYHIPLINLAIRPSILPSSKPLHLPVWFAHGWRWCAEHWSGKLPTASPTDGPSRLLGGKSHYVQGARKVAIQRSDQCAFPACWSAISAEDYAGITELVHWILVPLLLTVWVATVVQRRSNAMGNN